MKALIIRICAYLSVVVLRKVLPIDRAGRRAALHAQRSVAHLNGQAIFQVKQTRLADILDFGACLTDDGGLEARAGRLTRVPAKHGVRARTGSARFAIFLF